jgi:hypothetical protein
MISSVSVLAFLIVTVVFSPPGVTIVVVSGAEGSTP